MDQQSTVAAALLSAAGCALLAGGPAGEVVLLVRRALGWTQQDLAGRSGWSQSTISRIEEGKTRAAHDTQVLTDLAQALGIPLAVFGLADTAQAPMLDGVDRRDVLGSGAALAVSLLLPQGVATAGRISSEDVAQSWTAVHRLQELEWHQGGAAISQVADGLARRLQEAVRHGSYPAAVGQELHSVTLASMSRAAWAAYDGGREQRARQWWLEICHFADLAKVPAARVNAQTAMALHAGKRPGGGPEAISLAQAATATAHGLGTAPSLLSMLAAREAIGHAQVGDASAATAAVARARRWLDQGPGQDEPLWLRAYGPADLACHEMLVGELTRNGKVAETAARAARDNADPATFPRNHALYTVYLGSVLTKLGQLDEAISVTRSAVQQVHTVHGSRRLTTRLHGTVDLLSKQNYQPATTFAAAARRLLPTAA
ncbi:MAG: helix-turn-helix domain-containing protein [Pseudonocardiaceae bacterium]